MKIVLAIDGSDFSKVAVDELAGMPLPSKTEVCILNVYENLMLAVSGATPFLGGTVGNYNEEAVSFLQKSAEKIVSDVAKALKSKNSALKITTSVVIGLPKREILEKAEAFGADLIVIGSQGHGAFSRFLLGSVSQYVATHANCSVMIARNKDEK